MNVGLAHTERLKNMYIVEESDGWVEGDQY
jgi:hypothetical protein